MKRIGLYGVLYSIILLSISFIFNSCVDEKEEALGGIYGVVTKEGTTEVMPAIGIELYRDGSLLLKTVTFDDGHFEFIDLKAGIYLLIIVAEGWEETEYFVVVEGGRQARQDMQVKKVNTYMSVRTLDVTEIEGLKATLNGSVSWDYYSPNEAGFYYSTNTDVLNSGTRITGELKNNKGSFTVTINNLSPGKYYLVAYAKNTIGVSYGETKEFDISGSPIVETKNVTNLLANSATLNGVIVFEGDPKYTKCGFVYSNLFSSPTVNDPENATYNVVVAVANKELVANISSLVEGDDYYVRAYATHSKGTVYGETKRFKPQKPQFVILDECNIMVQKEDLAKEVTRSVASSLCSSSTIGGYNDWRLPTISELVVLYRNRGKIGGFVGTKYWSSTLSARLVSGDYYYTYSFDTNAQGESLYNAKISVRAVRTISE